MCVSITTIHMGCAWTCTCACTCAHNLITTQVAHTHFILSPHKPRDVPTGEAEGRPATVRPECAALVRGVYVCCVRMKVPLETAECCVCVCVWHTAVSAISALVPLSLSVTVCGGSGALCSVLCGHTAHRTPANATGTAHWPLCGGYTHICHTTPAYFSRTKRAKVRHAAQHLKSPPPP